MTDTSCDDLYPVPRASRDRCIYESLYGKAERISCVQFAFAGYGVIKQKYFYVLSQVVQSV
jgi:hypothetical protein